MEIILNKDKALKAVNVAKNFAETPSGLKILQHAFVSAGFGRARLTTTDLALWCQVEVDAQTPQPGTAMVPVRTMSKVLKSLSQSRVSLHKDGGGVRFVAGSSEVRVAGFGPDDDADEYPEINPPQDRLLAMPLNAALVDKVAYAVSKDETRYTLAGVYVEVSAGGLKLVATNGHRLARYTTSLPPGSLLDVELSEPATGIIPVRLLNEGVRLGSQLGSSVTLELYEKAAGIRAGSIFLWASLIEGQYPDYDNKRVIPTEFSGSVMLSKSVLGGAVSRLLALSKGRRLARVCLSLDGNDLVLKLDGDAGDGISATERMTPCGIDGIVPVCVLDVGYLSEALARLPDAARVQVKFSDEKGKSPVTVESPASAGVLAVIMPSKR